MLRVGMLLFAVPLAGCDVLFQIQHIDPIDARTIDGTPDAPVLGCAGTNLLHSSFTDNVDFARGWDKDLDATTNVQIVDRTLAVTTGVPIGYADAVSNTSYDFRGGMMQVKLVEPFHEPDSEMYMAFVLPTTNVDRCYIGVELSSDNVNLELSFLCRNDVAYVGTPKYVTLDPDAHRWLRIQQTGTTRVTFFTSADGDTWTARNEVDTMTYAFDSVRFKLGAGAYSNATATQPYTVRFDDFDFCGP